MSHWTPRYTDTQRKAVAYAYATQRIRPASRIPKLAAAGELTLDGEPLDPFDIPYSSAVSIGQAAERRKLGKDLPAHSDSADVLRRRLMVLASEELERLERVSKHGRKPVDAEQLRKVARALREIEQLPTEKRLAKEPGARTNGEATDSVTRDSLAGSLLRAADKASVYTARSENDAPQAHDAPQEPHVDDAAQEPQEPQVDDARLASESPVSANLISAGVMVVGT